MENLYDILEKLPITKGADKLNIDRARHTCSPIFCDYHKGDVIIAPGQLTNQLCVLCSGRANAYSADDKHTVMLRGFKPYEIFGVSNLFTDLPFATRIVAATECKVLIMDRKFLSYLIDNDQTVRYQYIAFLAQKTLYLNHKIACLTAGSAEKRLAFWLDAQAAQDTLTLEVPMSTLCTMLDMGRASLYRAFDQLEKDGFISRRGKIIRLYHREDMLSFYHDQ